MKRILSTLAVAFAVVAIAPSAQAQYVVPYTTYYAPTAVRAYYAPTVGVAPAVTTSYYAPSVAYSQPVYSSYYPNSYTSYTSYYAPSYAAPVYSAPAYTSYYAPSVSYAAPTTVYRPYTVASPVMVAPSPMYLGQQKTYYPLQPVRNVIRAISPGVPVYAY